MADLRRHRPPHRNLHWRNKTLLNSDIPDTTPDKHPNSDNLPEPEGL